MDKNMLMNFSIIRNNVRLLLEEVAGYSIDNIEIKFDLTTFLDDLNVIVDKDGFNKKLDPKDDESPTYGQHILDSYDNTLDDFETEASQKLDQMIGSLRVKIANLESARRVLSERYDKMKSARRNLKNIKPQNNDDFSSSDLF